MKKKTITKEGILVITGKGVGYVRVDGEKEDIEIAPEFLNTGLHGDRVRVTLTTSKNDRINGKIDEVLSRAKTGFSGTLEKENGKYFLVPSDQKMYTDILINEESLHGAKQGQKVFVIFKEWTDPQKAPIGEVSEILGLPGEHNAEMKGIALEKGFPENFPSDVEREAEKIKKESLDKDANNIEIKKRKDFREMTTFTIDPIDAKDFDDAISIKELPNGNVQIGIHIADVSHYVRSGTALDKEAVKRSTSLYLVDRTIPMLPEILSNDLCSLNPNEDKFTMSAVFEMTHEGTTVNEWFGKTIIHSDKRFSYEEAQEILDKKEGIFYTELNTLNLIAKKLTEARFLAGAISMEQEEVKFVLDDKGVPLSVYKKVRGDTNKLVEEFMLLANKKVAEFVDKMEDENVFVYRIHDNPDRDRITNLTLFLKSLGYKLKLKDGIVDSKELNKLLQSLEGKPGKETIQTAVVRSMAKAIYSTKNIGHYGLAFEFYTHFTSPIRRYPDVMVHRLLQKYIHGEKVKKEEWSEYETLCGYASQREKEASDAERASIKYKQVEYMSSRVGQVFDGIISSVTEWGVYVEEKETKCEGMVKLRDLGDDYYSFDEKNYRIVGERTKQTFTLGDKVRIKVTATDMVRKTIDYVFV